MSSTQSQSATEIAKTSEETPIVISVPETAPVLKKIESSKTLVDESNGTYKKSLSQSSIAKKSGLTKVEASSETSKSHNRTKSNIFAEPEVLTKKVDMRFAKGSSHYNLFGANQERSYTRTRTMKPDVSDVAAGYSSKGKFATDVGDGPIKMSNETVSRKLSSRGGQAKGGNPVTGEGYGAAPFETMKGRAPSGGYSTRLW